MFKFESEIAGDQDYLKKKRKNNNTEEKLQKNDISSLNLKNSLLLDDSSNRMSSSEIDFMNLSQDKTNFSITYFNS
jgi:hypothetical protein